MPNNPLDRNGEEKRMKDENWFVPSSFRLHPSSFKIAPRVNCDVNAGSHHKPTMALALYSIKHFLKLS
jgi:hypothetical protein